MSYPSTGEESVSTAAERDALEAVRNASGENAERDGAPLPAGIRNRLRAGGCSVGSRSIGRPCWSRRSSTTSASTTRFRVAASTSRTGPSSRPTSSPGTTGATQRTKLCADSIERHHELRSQWELGTEVELMRRADLVDVSNGLVAFGLDRSWLRELNSRISREGTYGEIARLLGHVIRRRPLTLPQIFVR